jgi:glycine betaine/proline transport system permease protein
LAGKKELSVMARDPDTEMIDSEHTPEAEPSSDGVAPARDLTVKSSDAQEKLLVLLRALLSLPKWFWIVGVVLLVGSTVPFAGLANVPEGFQIGGKSTDGINSAVDWIVVNGDPVFSAINSGLLTYLLLPLEKWLLLLPWWLVIAVVVVISYRIVGPIFAGVAVGLMLIVATLGIFELAMSTLALVIIATLLSVLLGVPTGILAARSDRFDALLRPFLDAMQTMPSFVYLIPVLMLFGLGMVPAVLATVIYAVPPVIRLTNLGIRQVDSSVIEAARAFGSTANQLLFKVQIPLAMPTIMAGLNQTIMMALAMVTIAAIIGARGLGVEVLNGIARLDVGRGLIGGIGIVVMAIILDRITQGFARSQQRTKPAQ